VVEVGGNRKFEAVLKEEPQEWVVMFSNVIQNKGKEPKLATTEEVITLKDDSKMKISSSTTEELEEFRIKIKEYLKDVKSVKTIKRSLHNMTWGQCSHMLQIKLKGDDELKKIELEGDVVALLKKIRGAC